LGRHSLLYSGDDNMILNSRPLYFTLGKETSIVKKYGSIETAGEAASSRYSRKAELYCFERENRARQSQNRNHELFWINMHYLYGLMRDAKSRKTARGIK